jgi:hypothetical protein
MAKIIRFIGSAGNSSLSGNRPEAVIPDLEISLYLGDKHQ